MDEESKDLKLIRRLIELNESSALNGNDIFYLSAERLSFLSDKTKQQAETIERLNSRNKRLLNAMNTMRDDLLVGATVDKDGTVFINVKRDVWEYFCAVIDNTENKLEAGEL